MKIIINKCIGGFGINDNAMELINKLKLTKGNKSICELDLVKNRNDQEFVEILERYGAEAIQGDHSDLKIVEIPDDVKWQIEEYDGIEWVAEQHRTWE